MTEWPTTTLEEVCAEGGGFVRTGPFGSQLHKSDYVDDVDGIPVVMPKNMSGGAINLDGIARIDADTADRLSQHLFAPGDVALSRRGDVGRSAFIDYEDLPAFCGTGCLRVHLGRPKSVEPHFLRYFFRSHLASNYLEGHAVGATMPNLNATIVKAMPVPIPPLASQLAIGRILGALDNLIENNRRRIELSDQMAQAIYREWFVHFRYPGHEDEVTVDSPLGPIPEGWEAPTLRDLVTTQYGYTATTDQDPVGPRFLRGMDMNKTSLIDWSSVPYCEAGEEARQKFRVEKGDVFVIRMADPGKVSICEAEVDAVFASYLVRLRPAHDRLSPYYLFFTLGAARYQGWVTGASTGSTRKSVSAKVMTEPLIALPPRGLQKEFESKVGPIRAHMTGLAQSSAKLRGLRDLLLPRLVSGQLDVSSLDLDAVVESVA